MATATNEPPDPLRFDVKIVDIKNGTPTQEFLRQWNRQRAVNVTVDDVVIDLAAIEAAITALENDVADIQDVDIVAGVGLSGGGNISGPSDVTIDLEDTAVTPGTYGNATNSAQITVDQQGRITSATNVPITGGGGSGGSFAGAWEQIATYSTGSATSTVDVVFPDGYTMFMIVVETTVGTDNTSLLMRVTDDDFATVEATGYQWWWRIMRAGAGSITEIDDASSSATSIEVASSMGNQSDEFGMWRIFVHDPLNSARRTAFQWFGWTDNSANFFQNLDGAGAWNTVGEVNGVRFLPGTGILDGTFKLYGLVDPPAA